MIKRYICLWGCILLLFGVSASNATTVSLNTLGAVTEVSGDTLSGIEVGSSISVDMTYDTETPVSYVDPDFVSYSNSSPFSLGFFAGSIDFSWKSTTNTIDVFEDVYTGTSQYYELFWLSSTNASYSDTLGGAVPVKISLIFSDDQNCFVDPCPSGNEVPMLDDSTLPDEMFDYESGEFRFWFTSSSGSPDASISFTQAAEATPVPVPATAWLLGSGLLAIFSSAKRKRVF